MKFLIYSELSSARLQYILDFFFVRVWRMEYVLSNSRKEFEEWNGPKFAYGDTPEADELMIYSCGLLFEKGVREQQIEVFRWEDCIAFFKSPQTALLPFDIFSASFYLISRYEEYLPFEPDEHGRFSAGSSLLHRNESLEKPLIDQWAYKFLKVLVAQFALKVPQPSFKFLSTIDIDNAYAYRGKGLIRASAAMARSILTFKTNEFMERIAVLLGYGKDPYDTYGILDRWHNQYNVDVIYFFLLGKYGVHDKNLPLNSNLLTELIKSTSDQYTLGIHPSYGSNSDAVRIAEEKQKLEEISHRKIVHSRQHFLRIKMPHTYRSLIEAGILYDHSMGFADHIGFRAGTSRSFLFFDLENDSISSLEVQPFAIMDATLNLYMKLDMTEALQRTERMIASVREYGGTFVLLWHNESLSDKHHWRGWQDAYRRIIKMASSD